jgi:hypothetical protein
MGRDDHHGARIPIERSGFLQRSAQTAYPSRSDASTRFGPYASVDKRGSGLSGADDLIDEAAPCSWQALGELLRDDSGRGQGVADARGQDRLKIVAAQCATSCIMMTSSRLSKNHETNKTSNC